MMKPSKNSRRKDTERDRDKEAHNMTCFYWLQSTQTFSRISADYFVSINIYMAFDQKNYDRTKTFRVLMQYTKHTKCDLAQNGISVVRTHIDIIPLANI